MKRAPLILALFYLTNVMVRTTMFISEGVRIKDMPFGVYVSIAFGIGLEATVAVAGYWYVHDPETRKVAGWVMALTMGLSLLFNEGEIVRTLSLVDLAPPTGDFLGWNPLFIVWLMQILSLVFGATGTVLSALMGMLQGKIDRIPLSPFAKKRQSANWKNLTDEDKAKVAKAKSPSEVRKWFDLSVRTAQNWFKNAKNAKKGKKRRK